ncbi:MAG TPA: tetratricopeptide repeat protein, partial [Blastocatellia bacterium]|nr:tetratricopeptide repeat protein [Blastocatellia bacterium]
RLVTLVGPGGIGKTRLALETASRVLPEFDDGVRLVELASCTDPALVMQTIRNALGVRDESGRTQIESLEAYFGDKQMLLVLDNCEHLVEACARVAATLLAASAGLRILATSQESLAVAGEAVWQVPALGVLGQNAQPGTASEAAQLFADRASLATPGFELTENNAHAVSELCHRLEGIPLAIELAAARVRTLTVEQMLERLDNRLHLLAGSSRSAPTRQQTMRAALDWSFDLLAADERALLEVLAVFAGSWTLETAEAVAGKDVDVLDLVTRLVAKSFVIAQGHSPDVRFRMLEIVREYARERLRESGREDDIARRHAEVFFALAGDAVEKFAGPEEARLLTSLETEHDNMRAALAYWLDHDVETCLHMASRLSELWSLHGHFREGLRWLTAAIEKADPAPSVLRVMSIRAAGEYAWRYGNLTLARRNLEESMRLARELDDKREIGWSGFHLALVLQQQGDVRDSVTVLEESLAIGRELNLERLVGNALNSLGEAARIGGDWDAAVAYFEQSLASHRLMGHPVGLSITLCNMGAALCETGDLEAARACYAEALPNLRDQGNGMGMSLALDGLGALAARRHEWERAARLAGAAEALRAAIGGELEPADRTLREQYVRDVVEHLGEPEYDAVVAAARTTDRDQVIDEALGE